jgi:uncharacterized membrane protein HdeD (DUF308 family)
MQRPFSAPDSIMVGSFVGEWRRLALRGAVALLFGMATLVWPGVTLRALVALWGAFVLVDGVIQSSVAFADPFLLHRGSVLFYGLAGIAAGVVTFAWPAITALALLYVIAVWALLVGAALIGMAVSLRQEVTGEWRIALAGGLSMLLAVLLVVRPGRGALALTWAIGWFACLFGVLLLALAWIVHRETSGPAAVTRHAMG